MPLGARLLAEEANERARPAEEANGSARPTDESSIRLMDARPEQLPIRFGRYVVESILGEGGHARVEFVLCKLESLRAKTPHRALIPPLAASAPTVMRTREAA